LTKAEDRLHELASATELTAPAGHLRAVYRQRLDPNHHKPAFDQVPLACAPILGLLIRS